MRFYGCTRLVNQSHLMEVVRSNCRHLDGCIVLSASDDHYLPTRCVGRQGNYVVAHLPAASPWEPVTEKSIFRDFVSDIVDIGSWEGPESWFIFFDPQALLPKNFRRVLEDEWKVLNPEEIYRPSDRRACSTVAEFVSRAGLEDFGRTFGEKRTLNDCFHLVHSSRSSLIPLSRWEDPIEALSERSRKRVSAREFPTTVLRLECDEAWPGGESEVLSLAPESIGEKELGILGFVRDVRLKNPTGTGVVLCGESGFPNPGLFGPENLELHPVFVGNAVQKNGNASIQDGANDWLKLVNDAIKSHAPDVILIWCESSPELLLDLVPSIIHNIEKSVWLCGWGYGYPLYPRSTAAIELLVQQPSYFAQDGSWAVSLSPLESEKPVLWPCPPPVLLTKQQVDRFLVTDTGLLFFVPFSSDAPAVVDMLGHYRKQWQGPICVVTFRFDDSGLRMMAARFGASFRILDEPRSDCSMHSDAILRLDGLSRLTNCSICIRAFAWIFLMEKSPFSRTVILLPSSRAYELTPLWDELAANHPVRFSSGGAHDEIDIVAFHRDCSMIPSCIPQCKEWMMSNEPGIGLRCATILRENAISDLRPVLNPSGECQRLNAEWLDKFRIRPVLPEQVPVVCTANDGDVQFLESVWASVDWGDRDTVLSVGASSISELSSRVRESARVLIAEEDGLSSQEQMLRAIEKAALTGRHGWIAYVAPYLEARPGAVLYSAVPSADVAYICPGFRFTRSPGGSCIRIPRFGEPATLINAAWFLQTLESFRNLRFGATLQTTFEQFAFDQAQAQGRPIAEFNPYEQGWTE